MAASPSNDAASTDPTTEGCVLGDVSLAPTGHQSKDMDMIMGVYIYHILIIVMYNSDHILYIYMNKTK